MESSLTFARHFARLVWLLVYDDESFDAQIASLAALVSTSRACAVTVQARDWRLLVNDEVVSESFSGTQDLTAQLIGHSMMAFTARQCASPTDLLLLARILASEPVPGDGGRNVLERLRALDARTIHVKVETLPAPRHMSDDTAAEIPGMILDVALFTPARAAGPMAADGDDHDDDAPSGGGERERKGEGACRC